MRTFLVEKIYATDLFMQRCTCAHFLDSSGGSFMLFLFSNWWNYLHLSSNSKTQEGFYFQAWIFYYQIIITF